jgi:hypothetical protein
MARTILLCLACWLFLNQGLLAQTDTILLQRYQFWVEFLAKEQLQGRQTGSIHEQASAVFIRDEMRKMSRKKVKIRSFRYQHADSSALRTSQNVVLCINNRQDSTILIGAHYDHIGLGGALSKNFNKKEVHNGADDNASGVALLLGLLHNYPNWPFSKRYNFVFVAYGAHENGLFGSTAFFNQQLPKRYRKLKLAINFDMVGRMDPQLRWLKIAGLTSIGLDEKALEALNRDKLKFRLGHDEVLDLLDTRIYKSHGIACLNFSTGIHDDYHKISDDAEKINYAGIGYIQRLIEAMLNQL